MASDKNQEYNQKTSEGYRLPVFYFKRTKEDLCQNINILSAFNVNLGATI